MSRLTCFFVLLIIFSCKDKPSPISTPKIKELQTSALIKTFKYKEGDKPLISVHRGGSGLKNYPENCLETLKYVNDSISAIFEIDVAKTKDDVLVLMHDNSLERTTTGTNRLDSYTYDELLAFNLVDDFRAETNFKIPKFTDVLVWAKKNNAVLTIDIKRSVDVSEIIKVIKKYDAQDISIIITYDVDQTEKAYKLAPNLLMSVSARNEEELNRLLQTSIPVENMLAFTGTRLSDSKLYEDLHKLGIKTILGTLGNLDRQAAAKNDSLYMIWHNKGIDIIATDRPFQAASALKIVK